MLLSAETNCAPDASIAHRFPPTGTPYPFPNAGAQRRECLERHRDGGADLRVTW